MTQNVQTTPHDLGAIELLKETLTTTAQLAEKQIELLRAEMKTVVEEERRRLIVISVGVAASVAGLAVLLVAAAIGLGEWTGHAPLWCLGFGLVVVATGGTLLTVGIRSMTNQTFGTTRHIVEEEIAWAKNKLEETNLTSSTSSETSSASASEANP
ncbi:MAG: phage holin family protein [Polyangia bacterium]